MEKILLNLALFSLNKYGIENKLDISDTYAIKDGRATKSAIKYTLVKSGTKDKIVSVFYTKNTAPYFMTYK